MLRRMTSRVAFHLEREIVFIHERSVDDPSFEGAVSLGGLGAVSHRPPPPAVWLWPDDAQSWPGLGMGSRAVPPAPRPGSSHGVCITFILALNMMIILQ